MRKVLAILTSVALVLGLLPAQGVSEALAEAGALAAQEAPVELGRDAGATELGDAVPADAAAPGDGTAIQEQQESSDAAATQPSGDDDATAAAQAASKGLNPSLTLVRYDEDSLTAYWALLFTAPGHGLKSFELTAELPSADVDGDGRADFRDELSGAPSVEGISPDVAFERGEGAFSLVFKGGLAENRIEKASRGGKSIKYPERPTTISFSTKVDPAWYASTGDAQDHTMSVKLVTTDSEGKPETFDLSATAQVENENWTCEHDNPGRYTVDDTERHTWHCGVCDYYEVHEHSFEGTGSSRTCACGAEGARVSFGAGGGTGSMPDVWKARGHLYTLPACAFAAPKGMQFQSWQVRVGDGVAEQHPAGFVVTLTDATTVTAVWKEVDGIKYKDASGNQKNAPVYTVIGPSTRQLQGGTTYVVQGEVDTTATSVSTPIEVKGSGTVNLVLSKGARLKTAGIKVGPQVTLNVFGQMDGAGTIQGTSDIAIKNNGVLNVYAGTVTGATGTGIMSDGVLTLAGGTVTGNGRWGVEIAKNFGVTSQPSTLSVRGNPVVEKNGADRKAGVRLEGDQVVNLAGALASGARLAVHVDGTEPRTFTRGWRQHMGTSDPAGFFESSSGWLAVDHGLHASGEATFYKAVPYIDESGADQKVTDFTLLTGSGPTTLTTGWYAVRESATIGARILIQGDVRLILCKGATLTCPAGVRLQVGNTLTIYAQEAGTEPTGKLVARASDRRAGIGGNNTENAGRLIVNGGWIEATGAKNAPGIGCGDTHGGNTSKIEEFRINDGRVIARGGQEGAGIGTADESKGNESVVNIYGGYVEATGGQYAAGIGGGDGSSGKGAKVTVSGKAQVVANGGEQAAGIGGGEDGSGGDLTVIGNECRIVARGQDKGKAVGRGDDGKSDGSINLEQAPRLCVRQSGNMPVDVGNRKSALRSNYARLEPCEHGDVTWEVERGYHRRVLSCKYCRALRDARERHDWDLNRSPSGRATVRECHCGAKLVRVCYDPGEGSGTMPANDEVLAGSDYRLPSSPNGLVPPQDSAGANARFLGWTLNGKRVDSIVPTDPTTTVVAQWDKVVRVCYDPGEGSGSMPSDKVFAGSDYRLPSSPNGLVPPQDSTGANARFLGWTLNGKRVDSIVPTDPTTTVVAQWEKVVRVCYDPGEGSGSMPEDKVVEGHPFALPEPEGLVPPEKPSVPEEYQFYKWSMDGKEYAPGEPITPSADSLITTVKALWQRTTSYIDENGATERITGYNIVNSSNTVWTSGWYVLVDNVRMTRNVTISGEVNLVLCAGASLDLASPITVGEDSKLNIYGHPDGEGEIRANNTVLYNGGSTKIYGGSFRSYQGSPDGVIKNTVVYASGSTWASHGELSILGGKIQSDVTSPCVVNEGLISMGGGPRFESHGAEDVYLASDTNIEMLKPFTYGTKVCVRLQSRTGFVTHNYTWDHDTDLSDPSTYFEAYDSDLNIGVVPSIVNGEVKLDYYTTYYDENDVERKRYDYKNAKPSDYQAGSYNEANYSEGWYIVDETLDLDKVNLSGDVNIILADDITLTVWSGIYLPNGSSLNVWTKQKHTGKLRAYSAGLSWPAIHGINPKTHIEETGRSIDVGTMGSVTIHGGDFHLRGGQMAAAMGDGDVRILGGKVVAEGGDVAMPIGRNHRNMTATGTLEIYETAKVYRSDSSTALPVAMSDRLSVCRGVRSTYARIEPCTHERMTFTITDASHTRRCPYCAVGGFEEPHDFDTLGVCKVCGYEDPNGPEVASVPSLETMDLVLGDQMGLTVYYALPELEGVDYNQSYVEFKVHDKTGQSQRVDFDPQKKSRLGDFYGFTCDLLPMQMGSPITATLHFGNDGVIQSDDLSVAGYVDYFKKNEKMYTEKEQALIRAAANFGHFVQPYLSAKEGWELGKDYPVMDAWFYDKWYYDSFDTRELWKYALQTEYSSSDAAVDCDLDLSISSDVTLDAYVVPAPGESVHATGRTATQSIWPEELEDGRLRFRLSHVSMGNLDTNMEVVGGYDWGDFWLQVSPLSYVEMVIESHDHSVEEKDAMLAMCRYWKAIKAYQES